MKPNKATLKGRYFRLPDGSTALEAIESNPSKTTRDLPITRFETFLSGGKAIILTPTNITVLDVKKLKLYIESLEKLTEESK